MKIEIKNLKHSAHASQETHCFTATIYIDGKREGLVSNAGCGGADVFTPWQLEERINEYAKTLEPFVYQPGEGGAPVTIDQDASTLIGDLVNEQLELASLKRQCAKSVLFRIPGRAYTEGEYNVIKRVFSSEIDALLVKKHGADVEIVNRRFVAQPKKVPAKKPLPAVTVDSGQVAPIW